MELRITSIGAVLFVVIAGCAASPSGPVSSNNVSSDKVQVDEWSNLSYEAKHARMTFTVHPVLARRFRKARSKADATLTCRSCHGPRAEEVRYRMPAIEALRPARVAEVYAAGDDVSPLIKFMRDEVTPTTARLMGVPLYDPATGQGFGCFSCHRRRLK